MTIIQQDFTIFKKHLIEKKTSVTNPNLSAMRNRRSFLKKSGLIMLAGSLPASAISMIVRREEQASNITVTLYVDTRAVTNQNTQQTCNFGQDAEISNEEYTIQAAVGDTITWEGRSSVNENDVVNIKSINHEGGKNVFNKNVLIGDGGSPEKVVGKVVGATGSTPRDRYKYKLSFKVTTDGQNRNGTFHIDPKIEVH